tara:strand:- start:2621 stop:3241 length:621 start_codon:yes stop_codon:yes gene_type:complete
MEARFKEFQTEYNLNDEAMGKMLGLFNDAFIEIAHKLINDTNVNVSVKKTNVKKTTSDNSPGCPPVKRFATKIAAEYAQENNLTLDDFDIGTLKDGKITKNDINTYLKANKLTTKKESKKNTTVASNQEEPWYKNPSKEKTVNKCCGMNKSGDPCKQPGTTKPDGANNYYCFRHGIDWRNFEVSSDSDLEEEPIEKEITCSIVDSE